MKKLLAISLIVAGTFASVGTASAAVSYADWAVEAFDTGRGQS